MKTVILTGEPLGFGLAAVGSGCGVDAETALSTTGNVADASGSRCIIHQLPASSATGNNKAQGVSDLFGGRTGCCSPGASGLEFGVFAVMFCLIG
jgi:hypothetical protein